MVRPIAASMNFSLDVSLGNIITASSVVVSAAAFIGTFSGRLARLETKVDLLYDWFRSTDKRPSARSAASGE